MGAEEQAAQYPRLKGTSSTKMFAGKEPKKYALEQLFASHLNKFDQECRQKLFEFGEDVLSLESGSKYEPKNGRVKMEYLALGKHSQRALTNPYFEEKQSRERMDYLLKKLRVFKCFQN